MQWRGRPAPGGTPNVPLRSNGPFAAFSRADSDGRFHVRHVDFAVAPKTCVRRPFHCGYALLDELVPTEGLDFHVRALIPRALAEPLGGSLGLPSSEPSH